MARADIRVILERVSALGIEIEHFVPLDTRSIQFRSELAGLLVVAMAAAYESCVKETLVNFAARHHGKFGEYTERHYAKLNSRVRSADLYMYCRMYDSNVHSKFGTLMKTRRKRVIALTGHDFTKAYDQILDWRHDYAHAGIRNTTVEEALSTHRFAKLMLYLFDDAFQ